MIPLSSLNSAIYLNWTIEFFHVTHITFAQIALLRLVGIAWHSKKLFLHHTQKERRLSHYYWFSIIAKSKGTEDECKHHSYSRNDFHFWTAWWIESRWTMTAASSLFLQNLIWREATIVWNGHQSKKLKNRFQCWIQGPHSVLNSVGANPMELIEWKVLEFVPSFLQDIQARKAKDILQCRAKNSHKTV